MQVYLTDRAQELLGSLQDGRRNVHDLIAIYERWPEEELATADEDETLRSVRLRMGITEESAGEIEDIGDALNAVIASPSHPQWQMWHEAKVRAIENGRSKKLVCLRHFTEADFTDDAVVQMFVAALAGDDQKLAIAFADRAASCIDAELRPDLVEMIVGRMAAAEQAGSRSAAIYAAALQMIYEKRAGLVPAVAVLDSFVDVVTSRSDTASLSAVAELACTVVDRTENWSPVLTWLRSSNPRRWLFAVVVLGMAGDSAIAISDGERRQICDALAGVGERLRDAATILSTPELEWLKAALARETSSLCS